MTNALVTLYWIRWYSPLREVKSLGPYSVLTSALGLIAVTNKNIHENTSRVSLKCLQAKPPP